MNRAEKRRQRKLAEKAAKKAKREKVASASPDQQTLTIQQAMDLAVRHHTAGDLPKAEGIYQQILQTEPNQPVALLHLGMIALQVGKHDTAVDLITKALAIKPNFAEAHNNLGTAFKELGRLDEAVASHHKALAIKPDFAEAHNNLGNALKDLGQLDEAVASYHKALAIKPEYAEVNYNLGKALQDQGKLDEAVASYHKALANRPDYAEAHNTLGTAFKELERLDEAVASYRKALAIKPDYAEAHNNLGIALQDLGKLDEAAASYRKALAIQPDFAEAHNNLGVTRRDQGRLDEAIECLRQADPDTTDKMVSATLLECYYRKRDEEGFARQLERISKNQIFNFRAAAASAFASHQWGSENSYKFCDRPIDLVSEYDLLDTGDVSPDLISEIETMVENNTGNEQFAPGHISAGFKSIGNLFTEKPLIAETLEPVIRRCAKSFVQRHNDNHSRLFRDWPAKYVLNGWYIRLLNGGDITAHIHQGWLSGVFYVRVPAERENDAGNIEFTLHGYGLPVIRDDIPSRVVTIQPGRLVLFPSSLPHRVIPFSENQERLSIAFDIVPA